MIRFGFELRRLDEVSPWGGDKLHWFALTEGWYGIEVRGRELFRPRADYYVVRLWEDIAEITPDVLELVPADLLAFSESDPQRWTRDPLEFVTADEDGLEHPVVVAASWHSGHHLDLGYLRDPPELRFRRTGPEVVTVDRAHEDDGTIRAARFEVPVEAYRAAVDELDRELMAAMRQRIEELERRGAPPGVDLDQAGLWREHAVREGMAAQRLRRSPGTAWAAVRAGARQLLPGS